MSGVVCDRLNETAKLPAAVPPHPQEACMVAWALSALQAQTPELWAAEMGYVAACQPDSLDEVGRAEGGVGGG